MTGTSISELQINYPKSFGIRCLVTFFHAPTLNLYQKISVEVPIFLHDEKKFVKVEVQLRTMSMDWWASQEHKIKYKKNVSLSPEAENELCQCAEIAAELDLKMEKIAKNI